MSPWWCLSARRGVGRYMGDNDEWMVIGASCNRADTLDCVYLCYSDFPKKYLTSLIVSLVRINKDYNR